VLLLTARDSVRDRIQGLDAGADDYLMKPFAFGELAARVRALVRRGAGARPVVLRAGDLVLDPAARSAARSGTPIELTGEGVPLLELFMRHPGEVPSRSRVLEHVWDFAFDPASNVVDQYVGYLRRKIDRPWRRNDLQTCAAPGTCCGFRTTHTRSTRRNAETAETAETRGRGR
jgi:two-component system OmpR family response regulator